jgi:aryl-alcohol dehydrogenase-like predicted oxidoreductase
MTMRYKLFGRTGLRVSELCLGAMTFGEDWGWGAPPRECARVLAGFAEAGGNFIDTANAYTNGSSERILGELIGPDRDRWVLSTKYGLSGRPDDPNAGGSHRKNMATSLEASLRRLGTDYVDVYWVHVWDVFTPVDEVLRGLDDLVRAGKVRYIGLSDTPAWLVAQANTLAELRGWTAFAGLQVPYSLVERTPERELLQMAGALQLTVTTWGPLGQGVLNGRYGLDRQRTPTTRLAAVGEYGSNLLNEPNLAIATAAATIAEERGISTPQVAIAWVLAQRHRAGIVPILGARTREQLDDNLAALSVRLTAAELDRLDRASEIPLGFPHDFPGRAMAYGTTHHLVDSHRPTIWPDL